MDADYDIFEIVLVHRDFWLFDAERYQRRYTNKHGQALAPGYYVVSWPEHIRDRRFDGHASYHGPFKERKKAVVARDWMAKMRTCVQTITAGIESVPHNDYQQLGTVPDGMQAPSPANGTLAKSQVFHWEPWLTGFPTN